MDTLFKSHFSTSVSVQSLLIGLGMLLMAISPIRWLVNSWFETSLDGQGVWVFLLCAGLFCWSVCSPQQVIHTNKQSFAMTLLFITTLIRTISQVCAVNVLGAVALAVDVYAIGLLLGLNTRKHALSAGWLSVLFIFSLPIERVLQRLIGFGLQHWSADGACWVLQTGFTDVQCLGMRILLAGRDVLVDLPCSGVKSLSLLAMCYVALMSLLRTPLWLSWFLGVLCLGSALLANVLRISLLCALLAYPDWVGGINVMAEPWHDGLGLLCLLLAGLPLMLYARCAVAVEVKTDTTISNFENLKSLKLNKSVVAIGFVLLAAVIVSLPRQALDVSKDNAILTLPTYLQNQYGENVALSQQEQAYFTQFGGTAVKMRYGDSSVLWLRTTSPLRHLHSPEDCLRGLGFDVQYQGVRYQPLPTVTYLATAKDGSQWRIAVSFYSEQQLFTHNVSEVVWRWLQQPHQAWYALQRITPIYFSETTARDLDAALVIALDLEHGHVYSH